MKLPVRYRYNEETLRFEPVKLERRTFLRQLYRNAVLSLILAGVGYYFYLALVGSPKGILLQQEHQALQEKWRKSANKLSYIESDLREMITRDETLYKVILDQPREREVGLAGSGGRDRENFVSPEITAGMRQLRMLSATREVQQNSYHELTSLLERRQKEWSARPAIQPIHNKQLDKLHMTYGTRFHPIFKVAKEHKGLDFAAPRGTPVYATGDGRVIRSDYSDSYGNVIYVDHQYGYETRYAHLSRIVAREGQWVKRGEIIGYVGNTGNSVASHLHYEVLHHGHNVNPIGYFQRDLSNREFEKLIEISKKKTNPLD